METTVVYRGIYKGFIRNNGKENGNHRGYTGNNGEENGNYWRNVYEL